MGKFWRTVSRLGSAPRLLIALALSGIFLFLAVYRVDLGGVLDHLGRVRLLPLLISEILLALNLLLRGQLWQHLLRPAVQVGGGATTRIIIIGYMANNVLPFRLGEILRAVLLGRRAKVPSSLALGSIVLERSIDVLCLLVVALGAFWLVPSWVRVPSEVRSAVGLALGALALVLLVILIFVYTARVAWGVSLWERVVPEGWRIRAQGLVGPLRQGMEAIRSPWRALASLGIAAAYWALLLLSVHCRLLAMGLDLPLAAAGLLVAFINFGTAIPAAPGALGAYHLAVVTCLGLWAIPQEQSLAYAVLFHGLDWLTLSLAGAIFLSLEPLGWGLLRQKLKPLADQ